MCGLFQSLQLLLEVLYMKNELQRIQLPALAYSNLALHLGELYMFRMYFCTRVLISLSFLRRGS